MHVEAVDDFIEGLKLAKNIYAECPGCNHIFSLHSSRLFYGKNPPKDMLSKSQREVESTLVRLDSLQERYDEDKDNWRMKNDETILAWRTKLDLQFSLWQGRESALKEKVRHMKSDIAAAQKEIIQEKVDRALLSQRGVIEGHISELFPLFRKTRINPADLCALIPTSPLDFIVFDGLFQKDVRSIVFLDVKKGGSGLSQTQRQVRNAVREGNVEFKTIRIDFENIKGTAVEE